MRQTLASLAALSLSFAPATLGAQEILNLDEAPVEFEEGYFDTTPWPDDYEPPRMADGRPSFEGTWSNASMTRPTFPEGVDKLVLTEQEAWDIVSGRSARRNADREAVDPNAPPPETGGDERLSRGYNRFWVDFGSSVASIDGELRSAWLVEPLGTVEMTPKGMALMAKMRQFTSDNPENRTVSDRCLAGFGGTGGPPMLNVLYNNTYVFAQDEEELAIIVEMVHSPRLIRIGGNQRSSALKPWLGDSVGQWEGDTLVVTTTNFRPEMFWNGFVRDKNTVVTERFTRVEDDTLFYEFELDDPTLYKRPHKGEMVFHRSDKRQYEYACHEGNYSMPGILAGARKLEQDGRSGSAN